MGIYSEAAEVVFSSQSNIYGPAKISDIAHSSGWTVNNALKIVAVENEEASLSNLLQKIEIDLGRIAVIASKLALIRFISEKEKNGQRLEKGSKDFFMRELYG